VFPSLLHPLHLPPWTACESWRDIAPCRLLPSSLVPSSSLSIACTPPPPSSADPPLSSLPSKSASSLPSIYSSTSLPAIQPLPPPSTPDITAQVRSFLLEKWKVGWGQDVKGKEFAKAVELLSQDNASARSFLEDVAPSTPHIETLALSFIVVMRCGAFDA
ncbi:hypothetical protein NGA_0504500, partial [Nannochloropsis gaditana CCMP526]|uniref:uncharacterized protein n=1 Tax=Nannochloropsis gaditana (strain CCMP526) TaxID=1093141 RepID=UPI00029F4F2C